MTTETDDLVKRLRDVENEGITGSDRFHLRNEAADTIERLQSSLAERTDYALAADLKIAALQGRLAACQCALKEKP